MRLELLKVLAWTVLLTLVTAGLGWLGIRDWDGETGGNWLALFALPGLIVLFSTESWLFALSAQTLVCLVIVCLVRGFVHLVRLVITSGASGPARQAGPTPE